jgi:hypothetical protein
MAVFSFRRRRVRVEVPGLVSSLGQLQPHGSVALHD